MGSDSEAKAEAERSDGKGPKPGRGGGPLSRVMSVSTIAILLIAATGVSFYQVKTAAAGKDKGKQASSNDEENSNYVLGLLIAGVALIGNAAVGALRKILSKYNIGSAQQVGLATLIQGVTAIIQCVYSGDLDVGPNFVASLPPRAFWMAAVSGSVLNSVVKTLETNAFSTTDMSLTVPFLAFDPVMQFVVGVVVMPVACSYLGFGCDEAGKSYPNYHVLSVLCIACGAFMLGRGTGGAVQRKSGAKYFGPLPLGSMLILLNCVIYGFTSRLDKVAIKAAGKTLYYAYGRLLMASTTLGGSYMSGGITMREIKKFSNPKVMGLIIAICIADAVYMLSLYQAFAWISPVYVTAIKRGGGILLSSILGVTLFGETMAGRTFPILTICFGVTFLCL
uniref:EamA domain-containing protein n=3 Tax=Hemiselmis andersenii TaxID=464988 RepID=A0A6U2ESQ9_HEMAN|mmetsp:Transcript_2864/g.6495  ORF Transcript_2864/g.6495 Transcript_2864/m.6495 type:complete len:393 (-) Transcript_2864:143-1321(-)|eukprot:CAMPEP_0114165678 /NCGR_PEP_ID=MMETSP0043_2-20121206/31395_1 /TAXON_ID=464988 /ORGANISM="Hemiselmis andersenii, Strain CCMP644" /LENGTH=392 /DNA_ID=CAMNT_0001262553 /DNA_START=245 /DNA_END=1423 /DNA_ORIENTATION=+